MLTLEEIGIRIYNARVAAGLNQTQVSERLKDRGLNISRETMSKIENGDRPLSAIELPVFAEVLSVTVDFLLKEDVTEDLVTLFRRKSDACIIDQEIVEIQDMIRDFIKQKQLHDGKLVPRKRQPMWR